MADNILFQMSGSIVALLMYFVPPVGIPLFIILLTTIWREGTIEVRRSKTASKSYK